MELEQTTKSGVDEQNKGPNSIGDGKGLKVSSVSRSLSDFEPSEISWITSTVGITNWEGGLEAKNQGHFVINVAGEVDGNADLTIPVDPHYGPGRTRKVVESVVKVIDYALKNEQKVVVHCAMGMERSVLSVAWYMHQYLGLSLDDAYEQIKSIRPIAADRRNWIGLNKINHQVQQED